MHPEKPKDISDYKAWLSDHHGIKIENWHRSHYESVTNKIQKDISKSDFWAELKASLGNFEGEYLAQTGYHLFMPGHSPDDPIRAPEWLIKPFKTFFLKTFRKNVLDNEHWPNEPLGGWVLPQNWLCKIDDIVRTLFVVKYMDGVRFLLDRLSSLWERHDAQCTAVFEAREEGYYAAHLNGAQGFDVPKVNWDTERIIVTTEIQITTQLQEVIRRLLHKYYEERRKATTKPAKWQWDHRSDEFVANYLGHILHYVEGMIMEIREKQEVR